MVVVPQSLAEALFKTNFELFTHKLQQTLGSCIPLLVEQYRLGLLQQAASAEDDYAISHLVFAFEKELKTRV